MRSINRTRLLLLLLRLHAASGWQHQPPVHSFWSRVERSTTRTCATIEDSNSGSGLGSSLVSRRQWLTRLTSATTASIVGVSLLNPPQPSQAATLVSTKAVCDPSVSAWKKDNRLVYLLGTAHISSASAVLAGDLVRDIHPTGVFVELDPKRVKGSGILAARLQEEDATAEGVDSGEIRKSRVIVPTIERISETVGAGGGSLGMAFAGEATSQSQPTGAASPSANTSNMPNPMMRAASQVVGNSIKGMYKKLDSAGFQAGEEFVVAIREGQKIGSDIVLGDRDVEVTLRRVTEGLARTDLKALMNPDSELEQSLKELVPSKVSINSKDDFSDLSNEEFREEFSSFVETMKAKENVRKVMDQLEKIAPALYQALVSERDAYMAAGLNGLDELETIVAVVGVAHVDGIERNLSMNGWKAVLPICAS